jgi:hypothetical protein
VSVLRSRATADDSKAIAGVLLDGYTFLPALSLAYAYTYAQDNPTRQVNFFIINFDAKFLPWAMLFMTFIIDGPEHAYTQFAGLIAAHLYDFLTRIWPQDASQRCSRDGDHAHGATGCAEMVL